MHDPLAAMKATDAVTLENWFPRATDVELRAGCIKWVDGLPPGNGTLMSWNGTAGSKLLLATDDGLFDISVFNSQPIKGFDCGLGQASFVNFSTIAGEFLLLVNGVNLPCFYNGSVWQAISDTSAPSITGGGDLTQLQTVALAKDRLWFTKRSSLSAYYLPVKSLGGTLSEFPLGSVFSKGGVLVAIASWTLDGGDGQDDYTVFVSSQGEVAVYKGTDPSNALLWSRVGMYYVGPPLGLKCLCQYGGDLIYLSTLGVLPLSKVLQSATIDRSSALTRKIDQAFSLAASLYKDSIGWEATVYPEGPMLIVNVPVAIGFSHQYVMNTNTGAWAKFTGWNASSFEVHKKALYFYANGRVAQAWTGTSDFGRDIVAVALQAYNDFRAPAQTKTMQLVRPTVTLNAQVTFTMRLHTDFQDFREETLRLIGQSAGSRWDEGKWDSAIWSGGTAYSRDWATVTAPDFYRAAFGLRCASSSAKLSWSSTDFLLKVGGVL